MANNFRPNDLNEIIAVYPPAALACRIIRVSRSEKSAKSILIELLWLSAQSENDDHREQTRVALSAPRLPGDIGFNFYLRHFRRRP